MDKIIRILFVSFIVMAPIVGLAAAELSEQEARYKAEVEEYRRLARERGEKLEWAEFAPPEIPKGREIHEKVMTFIELNDHQLKLVGLPGD